MGPSEAPILPGALEQTFQEMARRRQKESFHDDPVAWADYMLGATLWSKQKEVARSVVAHKSVAVKAGHGVGKSYSVALLICWWVDTRYPDCFVASTAPSSAQIGAIVWREVRKMARVVEQRYRDGLIDHALPGYITGDNKWKTDGGVEIGWGRKPPDNKDGDSFQGIHGAVLAVGDEATGLSRDLIDALGNITTNESSRRILIANPTNPRSHFAKIFKEDDGTWDLHTISVLDSPNFTGEPMPPEVLADLTGPTYAADKEKEYGGVDSPRYKARVLGEFAWDLGDTLIRPEDIAVAVDTTLVPDDEDPVVLGVDVARFGSDKSVVYKNQGGVVRLVAAYDQTSVTELGRLVHQLAVDHHAAQVRIDTLGVGGGVYDYMDEIPTRRYVLVGMNANEPSPDRRQWHNRRAWWWDMFRRDLRSGKIDLDLADETLADEFQAVGYRFNDQTGGLLIESKKDMKKRGLKSPDYADAAIYACADVSHLFVPEDDGKGEVRVFAQDLVDNVPDYLTALKW